MLQAMGSQRVEHDLAAEQQHNRDNLDRPAFDCPFVILMEVMELEHFSSSLGDIVRNH